MEINFVFIQNDFHTCKNQQYVIHSPTFTGDTGKDRYQKNFFGTIENFLQDKRQHVQIDGKLNILSIVEYRVQQGTVLGPPLFSGYKSFLK